MKELSPGPLEDRYTFFTRAIAEAQASNRHVLATFNGVEVVVFPTHQDQIAVDHERRRAAKERNS